MADTRCQEKYDSTYGLINSSTQPPAIETLIVGERGLLGKSGLRHGAAGFLNRTPGPPPFSAMNSMPAVSRAVRMAACDGE